MVDAIEACNNIEKNGGDDVDDDSPIEACPSCHDVLRAVATITCYVSELNDPFAHKIEALLGSLTRFAQKTESASVKDTVLTDFFQPLY